MSTAIYIKNMLNPHQREVREVSTPSTVRELAPVNWQVPYLAFVDSKVVLRADWELVLEPQATVAFVEVSAIPQGGGGGGSDTLRMVAMLAVMVAAPEIGAFMGPGVFGAGVMGLSAATWTSVAMFAGMSLVNALIPPPKPTSPQQAAALAAPSPTYSIQAQGNQARLDAAIPEHFGRLKVYPDFAAQPYQEYVNNDQYVYELLCLGRGSYDISGVYIEDTPIKNVTEVAYQTYGPHQTPLNWPASVTTSAEVSGQTLDGMSASYVQAGLTVTVTFAAHGLSAGKHVYIDFAYVPPTSSVWVDEVWVPGGGRDGGRWIPAHYETVANTPGALDGDFVVISAPTPDTFTVTHTASANVSGSCTVSPWIGGFIANASGTVANAVGLDFVAPKGLYYANDNGSLAVVYVHILAQYRPVDSVGVATGEWTNFTGSNDITYGGNTTTPQRYTQRYDLPAGRYEVRVRRIDPENKETRAGHNMVWASLRTYMQETRDYGDVTLMSVRMKATNNLSSMSSRKLNVIATRKLPVWNGSTWSAATATSSPAWALAYAAKQVGLTDANIDLAALLALDATCTARGDSFNGRFDNFLSVWEALTKIAGAVRAKPFMQAGVLRVVRDQPATVPVALFSQRNIVKGSFSVNYLMPTENTADAVDVAYFDETTWASATVQSKLPSSTAEQPAKVDLFGVTNRAQAHREGMYQAASNRYRRKMITFKTEMEGFIPSFGDLIAIQHDMPAWGQGGEVTAVATSGNMLVYSEQFEVWAAYNGATVTPNAAASPFGDVSAGAISVDGSVSAVFRQSLGVTAGTTYTFTIWAKAVLGDNRLAIDIGDGVSVIKVVTTDWARYTFTAVAGSAGGFVDLYSIASGAFYVYGAQLVQGSAVLPYVRTTAAPLANVTVLTLSEQPTFGAGNNYIGLRKRDGSLDGPYLVTASGGSPNDVVLDTAPTFTPYTGTTEERTHYAFGFAETWRQPARLLSAKPQSLTTVEIVAVGEDSNVHTAENDVITPAMVTSQLSGYSNAPVVTGLLARFIFNYPNQASVTWQASPWADRYYVEVSNDGRVWTRIADTTATQVTITAIYGSTTMVRVCAVNLGQGAWTQTTVQVVPPADPTALVYAIEPGGIRLKWPDKLEVDFYELRLGGTSWETSSLIAPVTGTEYLWKMQTAASYKVWVKAIDINGNYSNNAVSVTVVVVGPSAVALSYALSGPDEVLSWTIPTSGFTVDRYEVRYGATWAAATFLDTTKATSLRRKVNYSGARTYWVAAIDVAGNYGTPSSVAVTITAPGSVTGARADVVDNNALLYWGAPTNGSLPVDRYEVRKGASWAAGTVIGSNGNSTFTTVFEQLAGTYTYWIAAVNTAGTFGTAVSLSAYINQPPDYVLHTSINSTFSGTRVNVMDYEGGLLLPVSTTETVAQHFTTRSWTTPQNQIAAGYPIYIEPSLATASYSETIDYGSTVPTTNIVVTLSSVAVVGTVTASCQIQWSNTSATGPWTSAAAGATSALATNFRWVRVTYTFAAAGGTNLLKLTALNIKLSVKQRSDSGSSAIAPGSTSAAVAFGYPFTSANTPVVQANYSVPVIPVVDYVGGTNPTGFTVYFYSTSGTLLTAPAGGIPFSWSVKGY